MQKLTHQVWRGLLLILALAIRAPALVVAVWGALYLVRCVQTLTAPGVPVEYRYESKMGTMLMTAESYQFDLETMQGIVQRVHVYDPEGREVARTDYVDFLLDGNVSVIRLNDPLIRARRLADGRIDVLEMLPVRDPEELTEGAYRFYADSARIEYTDVSVDRDPVIFRLSGVTSDGADGNFMFKGNFASETTAGWIGGTYEDTGRLIADVQLDRSEVAHYLPYIYPLLDPERLGEFARVSADSLYLDGTAQIWSEPDGSSDVRTNLRVEGRGLRSAETLRGATLNAELRGSSAGVWLRGEASQPGISAFYDGSIALSDAFRMTGRLIAQASSREALPPVLRDNIDPGLEFTAAAYDGNMDTDGERYLFDGNVVVEEATYAGETTRGAKGHVRLDNRGITARIDQGSWAGVQYSGAVAVNFDTGALSGGFRSERGRIEPLAEHFGTDRLHGIVSANAVLKGTVDAPIAEIYARGSGGVQVIDGPLTSIGVYELRGRLDSQGLYLDRLTSNSQNGVITAKGYMLWDDGKLSLVVKGGGLDMSAVSEDLEGLGFVNAVVTGTRDEPQASGRLEVYGFEALDRKVPQIVADWSADKDRLFFERFAARAGTGQIDATGAVLWADRSLSGQFSGSGVRLEEWLSAQTLGSVSVQDGVIGGTLADPFLSARLTAGPVFVGAVEVDSIEMEVQGGKSRIESPSFIALVDGGELLGSGLYDFEAQAGSVNGRYYNLPLASIPLAKYSIVLEGLASGEANVSFDETGPTTGALVADVENLVINGTKVGQGGVQASLDGHTVLADAEVGSLERYLRLSDARYNLDTKAVGGELLAYNLLFTDITESVEGAIKDWPQELKDILENTTGLANAAIIASGTTDDIQIDVESFTLTDLTLRGRGGGEVRASGNRRGGLWTIDSFTWANGDTSFNLAGTVTEDGGYDVAGGLNNFQISWLNTLFPDVPLLNGTANLVYNAAGTFDNPSGYATLDVEQIGYFEGERAVQVPLTAKFDVIQVADRNIELLGTLNYQGLIGDVTGNVPFSSLYDDEAGRTPMQVDVDIRQRDFAAFEQYLPAVDGARSAGTVDGSARVAGLWGDLDLFAELNAKGETLAFKDNLFFRDIDAKATWNNGDANLAATFKGEERGTGELSLRALFPDIFAEGISVEDIRRQTTLDGTLRASDYRAQVTLPGAEQASGATISSDNFRVTGTIASPQVSGDIALSEVFVRLPDEFESRDSAIVYPIDPAFANVTVTVEPGARLVTDNARIVFSGTGRISGSLQNPDVLLPLTVSGGRFDLPTARIAIEEGGSINVGYRSTLGTSPSARVDLNLEGNTHVSARRSSNEYETYEVHLFIRGNLLDEDGLQITATSDPPDLSSDQIMAILGQKELIENLARGGSDADLRQSLYAFGLPTAGYMFTSSLAESLGLDYISIDYNPFDQTTLGVGKSLGKGLMLHASRQLDAETGERLKYEVLLTYRLPMRDAIFSRVRLSFGFDELVPWKLKLNWSRRF